MPDQTPQPTPATDRPFVVNHGTPFWQVAVLAVAMLGGSGLQSWWNRPATVQPAPAVVSQPVVAPPAIDPSRTQVTKDDIGVDDKQKDAAIAFVQIGDGNYSVVSTPVGSKRIVKQIIVSTISDTVTPTLPKPVDPQPDVKPVEPVPSKPTAAFYVYEKDDTAVPNYVKTGLSKVNASGIEATLLEEDTKDGNNQVPARFQVPLAEAKKAGLPVFVVMSNGQFLRAVKPKSESEMLEAVK